MKLTKAIVAALILLLNNANFGLGFLPKNNLFFQSSRRVKIFNDQFVESPRFVKKNDFEAGVDIAELATSTLGLLRAIDDETAQYKIVAKSLYSQDKHMALEHQDKMNEANNKLQYYKGKASFLGQRYALEQLFRKVRSVTKTESDPLRQALLDSGTVKYYDVDEYLNQVISADPPKMEHLNEFVTIPEVDAVLQPLIGYSIKIPHFTGRLVEGVLAEPENETESYDTICVAQGDKHADFFADLARLLNKCFHTYDPARAYVGQVVLRKERGLKFESGEPFLP